MATKTFCDLCHGEIAAGDAKYVLKALRLGPTEHEAEHVVNDVCNACVQRVTTPLAARNER